MNKKFIWAIIILMSMALFGIAVTQYILIKTQVDLDEKSFEINVYKSLNEVKKKMIEDAEELDRMINTLKSENNNLFGGLIDPNSKNYNQRQQLRTTLHNVYPDRSLDNLDIEKLDNYLRSELEGHGLKIKYDYGVYSNKEEEYIFRNGSFAVPLVGNASKPKGEMKGFESSPYKVNLFGGETDSPGYLRIFFPGKQSYLWSNVLAFLLTSFLFTALVLLCFAYTIFVIFRQKKVSEMKTDFINNMTHEFKTPIATISLASDSITNSSVINDENKVKRFAGIIKQENKRMLNQVEKVLQMAKIDKRDFELKVTDVNLNDVIYQATENARLKIIKREGSLSTDLKAEQPIVKGDVTHISNIVHNLLDNAEKYSSEKPVIKVTTRNVTNGVEVNIIDNGIGMSPDSVKHIFDKFYRVHTGNRHDVKGFGLGLSYVKALIDAHEGSVKVISELGTGSTFRLFFPFNLSD